MGFATPDEIATAPELRQCGCSCSHNEWQHHNGECQDHDGGAAMEQAYADECYRQMEEDHYRQMAEEHRANLAEAERHGRPLPGPMA